MESTVPVVSNERVAEKNKKDIVGDSGSQVAGGDDYFQENYETASDFASANLFPDIHLKDPLFANQEVPDSELATGSSGSSSDPKNAPTHTLIPASGPIIADIHDESARIWSPNMFDTYFHLQDYTTSSSPSPGDLAENKTSSQERKTHPDLPDYDSQGSSSPGNFLESKVSSQEAKAYPDLPSYDSQGSSSPGNLLDSQPSSQEAKAYPDLPSYDSQYSSSPGNFLESQPSSQEAKEYPDLPSYDSQCNSSPRDFSESQPLSQETKEYPNLPSYDSQCSYSPRDFLESNPSSQETEAFPDLPDYTSSSSSRSPGNWLETESSDDKGSNARNLAEESVDLSLLVERNSRKSVEAVPGIASVVGHADDSNSTELCAESDTRSSQSSSNSE